MTNKKTNKFVSIVLLITMLVGLMSITAIAEPDASFNPLTNVEISGDFDDLYVPGVTFALSYDGADQIDESLSTIAWYMSDSEDGEYTAIEGATAKTFKTVTAQGGKYLKAGITPVSTDGNTTGVEVFSNIICMEPALAIPTQIYNTAMDDIGWSAYSANVIKADGFELGNNKTKFIILDAAEDGSDFLVIDDYMDKTDIASFGSAGLAVGRTLNMDPSDPNNTLAYWLNTTYLNNPNYDTLTTDTSDTVCSAYVGLPKAIIDHIDKDAVWRTERSTNPNVSEEYVFRAAITLPSYTEIKMYGNKLMRIPNRQLLTRSVHNVDSMYAIGDYGASGPKHLIGIPITTQGVIRPIFRLKRSFFTENRIEPAKMGENVKTLLVEHFKKSELSDLYTEEELMAMGFGIGDSVLDENYKPLSNIKLSGDFDDLYVPGVTFTLTYDGADQIDESLSTVAWYMSDSEDGEYTAIEGATAKTFKTVTKQGGKYLKAGITPISADLKTTGAKVYSEAVYIEPALATPTQIYNTAMDDIGWSAYSANVIKADGFELGNNKTKFIILDAAEDGSDFLVIDDYMDKTDIASFGGAGLAVGRTLNMDPSDPNNTLAYWLNTTYFNSTNYDTLTTDTSDTVCSAYVGLPKAIIDHIDKDAVWRTERSTVANVSEEYVFRAAITLPSYTEIKMYGNKLMRIPNRQLLTRSVHNVDSMYAIGDYGANGAKHLIGIPITTQGVIRPIFRLKRSFFTENRIEPAKMGENVKTLLVEHFSRSELSDLYAESELTEMGFGPEPTIENIKINGTIKAGCTVNATFETDVTTATVEYAWSYADSKKGEFTALEADTNTYKIADSLVGKYIRIGIRVKDTDGNLSGWNYYVISNPVGEKPDMIVTADSLTYASGKINASFEFENSLSSSKSMAIILAVYDDTTNELIGCDITPITAENGINSYNATEYAITVSANQYIKGMVWDSILDMNPYCLNVLDVK